MERHTALDVSARRVLGCRSHGVAPRRWGTIRNRHNCGLRIAKKGCALPKSLNDHESDVVSLRHALGEFVNGFQKFLLDRVTS